jgi:phytoene dehydrogenase-like protein
MSFYAKQTAKEYAARFKSPLLKNLLENVVGGDYAATGMIFTMATLASGDGGYPEGGSLGMANRIARNFEALGGKIYYKKAVSKVAVKDGKAVGIMINNEFIPADAVIVTRDTLTAIDTLFDSPIHEEWTDKMRKNTIPMLDTFISIGVEADLSDLPENLTFVSEEPLMCGGIPESIIYINNYAGFKGYAPEGCTSVTSFFSGDSYDYWKRCKENGTYEAEKQKLAEDFIKLLAKKYPKTESKVAVWDVATPLTYERYLGSYKGSWMTLMGKGGFNTSYPSKPETIKNVYFASHRLMPPGGLPVALETGRKAVQYLCKDTDTVFQGKLASADRAVIRVAGE